MQAYAPRVLVLEDFVSQGYRRRERLARNGLTGRGNKWLEPRRHITHSLSAGFAWPSAWLTADPSDCPVLLALLLHSSLCDLLPTQGSTLKELMGSTVPLDSAAFTR